MRTARALASAVVSVALAACAYDIPNVVSRSSDAGAQGGDGAASIEGGSSSSNDSGASSGGTDAGGGGSGGASSGGASDAAGASDAPCTGTLCECSNASGCSTRICAQSLTVGSPLYAAAGGRNFCTRSCCTSADCDPGTVCFATGQGGNYCVSPAWLGRSAPGGAAGGASCTTGTQCRSGLCASGACADTCCSLDDSAQECAGGAQCTFGGFPGSSIDTHFTARCGPAGGPYGFGASCTQSTECAGGLCVNDGSGSGAHCTNACRSAADCQGGGACLLYEQGTDVYAACFPSNGFGLQGSSCSSDGQCEGYWCGSGSQCTNICFTDAECMAGWHCTPQPDTLPTGTYLVLGCGP